MNDLPESCFPNQILNIIMFNYGTRCTNRWFFLQLFAVKNELSDIKSRASADDVDAHHGNPSSPRDINASSAINNFDEAGTIPLMTNSGKVSHRNSIDKKPVADWV